MGSAISRHCAPVVITAITCTVKPDKDSSAPTRNMILAVPPYGMCKSDVHRLKNLHIDIVFAPDGAGYTGVFSTATSGAEGSVTPHAGEETPYNLGSMPGVISGQVSFWIPGFEQSVDGLFVFVEEEATCEQTKQAFGELYDRVRRMSGPWMSGSWVASREDIPIMMEALRIH